MAEQRGALFCLSSFFFLSSSSSSSASYLFSGDFTRLETVAIVRDFPAEEDGEEHADADKDGQQPENPSPSQVLRQLAGDEGRNVGKGLVHDDEDGGARAPLVHKVQVADEGVDDALKVRHAQALHHARAEHRAVRRGRRGPDGPGERADHGEQEAGPLAVLACPGGDEGPDGPRDQETVSGQVGEFGKVDLEVGDEWYGDWGKSWSESRERGGRESEMSFIHRLRIHHCEL